MVNVILPVVEKLQDYERMLEDFSARDDVKFYVGTLSKFRSIRVPKNAVLKVFKDGSGKEEVINALHSIEKEKGKIIVVRRPLKKEELDALLNSSADIAYLKKAKSKFANWWANLWKKLIKKIFSFYYFEDISAIMFGENTFNLISSLTNLSYITRIDRFVGFKMEEVASAHRAPKKDYDRFDAISKLVGTALFFVLTILISVIISTSFTPIILMALVSILLCVIGLFAFFMAILNFVRTLYVGTLRHGRAEECLNI